MLDALAGHHIAHAHEVRQTYIVVRLLYQAEPRKFVSPALDQNLETLQSLLENKDLRLYINKHNPEDYRFEW